ncbi:peroxidase [Saccharobesus litoralis]|uniref:Peroxidase n=1 Tax=Saccharobesus litoralis TaxID=2172099 RepID=A0A2S0VRF4_9ALTE|nr:Dyp-type peroxidase [Saccharobesus litoralis]AWB66774.1 peroxidase [Saccharobesus litoralis]
MARPQPGLLAEANLQSLYLLFKAVPGTEALIRHHLACFHPMINDYCDEYSESELSAFVAIGSEYWRTLFGQHAPKRLKPFPEMAKDTRVAPHTPYDVFIHIRSDRVDVNHLVGSHVCELFADSLKLVEQVKGFRYLDGRDLTGFVDGTENPHGAKRRQVALVDKADDSDFAAGSYVHIQRYRHQMERWNETPTIQQEDIIGRTKSDNQEYPSEKKSAFAHIKRTNLKDAAGNSIEILRQSMPYGTMKVQGLFFISICHSPEPFELMLSSMINGDEHGVYDKLLDYTRPETGAAFFAPSLEFLRKNI